MIQGFERQLKARVFFVFAIIHLGLIVAIVGLARLSVEVGGSASVWSLAIGVGCLYLGVVVGGFFVVWPLLPWIRKANEARTWWEQAAGDLPQLIALIKHIIETLRPLANRWTSDSPPVDTSPVPPPKL